MTAHEQRAESRHQGVVKTVSDLAAVSVVLCLSSMSGTSGACSQYCAELKSMNEDLFVFAL